MDISHNQIQIDVTDKFSKERKGKDIGYFLDIKVTKKTTVTDDTGNNIKLEEISIGDLVEVTLTEPISFHDPSALRNPVEAKYLILHNQ